MREKLLKYLLGYCMLYLSSPVAAQAMGNNVKDEVQRTRPAVSKSRVSMEQTLLEIKRQFNVNLIYESGLLNDKYTSVNVDDFKNSQLEGVLQSILKPYDLGFVMIDDNNYSIYNKNEKVQDLQGLIEKKDNSTLNISSIQLQTQFKVDRNISGTVVDAVDGQPLPGATISVKGKNIATQTNLDGEFNLSIPDDAKTLVFTFIGYISKEVTLTSSATYKIQMHSDTKTLKEVVVTGIFKKPIESFTGSATTVTAKELKQYSNRNLITALRNIDPSLNIIENNSFGSNPNVLPDIQIRGNSTLPNSGLLSAFDPTNKDRNAELGKIKAGMVGLNTPLVILDGFTSNLQRLYDINPELVESITILKDASATAIYGSRGSNGVIVVVTKSPQIQKGKLQVTYSAAASVEAADLSSYSLLNAKDKLDLEQKAGLYNLTSPSPDLEIKNYYNYLLNEVNSGVNTYWLSKPLTTGVGQRHNLSVAGGDEKFRYAATIQMNDIQGAMKGSDRKTYNGNVDLSYTNNKIKFRNNLMISQGQSANSPYGNFSQYVTLNPYWRAFDENGQVIKQLGAPETLGYNWHWKQLIGNPLYDATLNTFDKTKSSYISNQTSIELPLLSGLMVRGQIGIDKGVDQSDKFRPGESTAFASYTGLDVLRKGDYNYGVSNSFSYDASLNLNYSKTFNKHLLFAGLDYNIREDQGSNNSFLAEGFNNQSMDFISMALQYAKGGKPTGSESLTRAIGLTGNINYVYDQRYFVDGVYRLDGASQFGSNKRFAPFWSIGTGWNIHNESFMQNQTFFNLMKLRGSFGVSGSQSFGAYQARSTYGYYTDDIYFAWNGAQLLGLGNENLKWQQTKKYDVGMDAAFLKNRIKITADYYLHKTDALVSSMTLPASTGFNSYTENIGKVENRGFELRATGFLIQNPKFSWSISGAMMQNKNKIIQISQALKDAQSAMESASGSAPNIAYREGYSTNTIWVVPSLGIDPSTGRELYMGKDGQATYTWSSKNIVAAGVTDPKLQGNLSTMVHYNNLTLNVNFGYHTGGQLYNQTLIDRVENANLYYNVDSRVYTNRWQKPGDVAAFKGLNDLTNTNNTSRFVQNENTINCQNISLMYDIRSKSLANRLGLEVLSFSASVADPFYYSTVKQERGISYPFSRQFYLSVYTTF